MLDWRLGLRMVEKPKGLVQFEIDIGNADNDKVKKQ